jgi:hypothetical protein
MGPRGADWANYTTDRITPLVEGYYIVVGGFFWASNNVGIRYMNYAVSGALVYNMTSQRKNAAGQSEDSHVVLMYFDGVDDYVYMQVYQSSGGALNCTYQYLTVIKAGF